MRGDAELDADLIFKIIIHKEKAAELQLFLYAFSFFSRSRMTWITLEESSFPQPFF